VAAQLLTICLGPSTQGIPRLNQCFVRYFDCLIRIYDDQASTLLRQYGENVVDDASIGSVAVVAIRFNHLPFDSIATLRKRMLNGCYRGQRIGSGTGVFHHDLAHKGAGGYSFIVPLGHRASTSEFFENGSSRRKYPGAGLRRYAR
jgi:hypothetical protein